MVVCSHATLGLYKKILHRAPKALNRYFCKPFLKVFLSVDYGRFTLCKYAGGRCVGRLK